MQGILAHKTRGPPISLPVKCECAVIGDCSRAGQEFREMVPGKERHKEVGRCECGVEVGGARFRCGDTSTAGDIHSVFLRARLGQADGEYFSCCS